MVTKKNWNQFQNTGLLLIINQVLHCFGWSIVLEVDEEDSVINAYPARVKFRGFDEGSTSRAYRKVGKYMASNAKDMYDQAEEANDALDEFDKE